MNLPTNSSPALPGWMAHGSMPRRIRLLPVASWSATDDIGVMVDDVRANEAIAEALASDT